jgi:hypothetical protein
MTLSIDDEIQLQPATSGDGSIIPEGRYTLHLIRVETAPPSTFKPEDGPRIKWTFNLYAELVEKLERGELFEFNGSPYEFFRHTSTKNSPRAFARMYAEALMGRKLDDREVPKLGPLVGSRMSAMISYDDDPEDSSRQILKMSGLKHVPTPAAKAAPKASPSQVSADPTVEEVDRALLISKLEKKVAKAVKKGTKNSAAFAQAMAEVDTADMLTLQGCLSAVDDELDALDD